MSRLFTNEEVFAYTYLAKRNLLIPENLRQLSVLAAQFKGSYEIVPKDKGDSFYTELAEKMRELWPQGEKDGKWPWRDTTKNLAMRLHSLWQRRHLGDYTIEQCLTVARRYLAQFENDTKYMKILKYFILKQTSIVEPDGKLKYTDSSTFADMLESEPLNGEDTIDLTEMQEANLFEGEIV